MLYYMMRALDMSLLDAFKKARDIRQCVRPNDNFWRQLVSQEARLRGTCSCSIQQYQARMLAEAFPRCDAKEISEALERAGWDSVQAATALGDAL